MDDVNNACMGGRGIPWSAVTQKIWRPRSSQVRIQRHKENNDWGIFFFSENSNILRKMICNLVNYGTASSGNLDCQII